MLPLQFGIPGGVELLIIGFILFSLVIPLALAYYVYTDAESRGMDTAALWAIVAGLACLVATPIGGLVVLAVYLMERD